MEKREIIYSNLLQLLKEISPEGASFEAYYNAQNPEIQPALLSTSEEIERKSNLIRASKLSGIIHTDFDELIQLLSDFKNSFDDYPNHRIIEISLLIGLITRLNLAIDEEQNLNDQFDVSVFILDKLDKIIHENNFAFFDNVDLENSIVLLNLSDIPMTLGYLESNPLPVVLYWHLLSKIGDPMTPLEPTKYVLVKSELSGSSATIWACLGLHIVKEGKLVHSPYTSTKLKPSISSDRKIICGTEYQQFNDSLIILSEYNDQKDILDKYLRIYHVIENFMYKYPLVNLERSHNGAVFSIRDFQRMFDKINSKELNALTKLIKRISEMDYDAAGTKFSDFIFSKWSYLHPNIINDQIRINSLLRKLRITRKDGANEEVDVEFGYINLANTPKIVSQIIYAFRNSLVHNRETEFHLSHDSLINHSELGDTAKLIIEEFLLPIIEEIVYHLIIEENEITWFKNSYLNLYDEE